MIPVPLVSSMVVIAVMTDSPGRALIKPAKARRRRLRATSRECMMVDVILFAMKLDARIVPILSRCKVDEGTGL